MKKTLITSLIFGTLFLFISSSHAATCSTTDVTVTDAKIAAFSCENAYDTNNSTGDINALFGEPNSSIVWEEAAVLNLDDGSGLGFSTVTTGTEGSWTYEGDPLSSPFIVILKAGNDYAAYLFKGLEDLFAGETGTFLISFFNDGDKIADLSHIAIYSTDSEIPDISTFGNPVPLPAALWLFGPALLGFMGFRRKNQA